MSVDSERSAGPPRPYEDERVIGGDSGRRMLALGSLALVVGIGLLSVGVRRQVGGHPWPGLLPAGIVALAAGVFVLRGLIAVAPGEAVVVQIFGRYLGSLREPGLRWVPPWTVRRRVSLRIRGYETAAAKVNDAEGNPIEIGVVAIWQVADSARAVFAVEDVGGFVATQVEIAARQIAMSYPYDDHGTGKACLRSSSAEISAILSADIAERVGPAGVQVVESRVVRLSYAPEIAHAMLRRQQADAIVAARARIVDGAVGMVEGALARLSADGIVDLDEDRKAAMVSNMLVVLCSEQATTPVVNTGTIYQ